MLKKPDRIDPEAFWSFIENKAAESGDGRVPYNPESFLLISAGKDGQYLTDDDIVNWNR